MQYWKLHSTVLLKARLGFHCHGVSWIPSLGRSCSLWWPILKVKFLRRFHLMGVLALTNHNLGQIYKNTFEWLYIWPGYVIDACLISSISPFKPVCWATSTKAKLDPSCRHKSCKQEQFCMESEAPGIDVSYSRFDKYMRSNYICISIVNDTQIGPNIKVNNYRPSLFVFAGPNRGQPTQGFSIFLFP